MTQLVTPTLFHDGKVLLYGGDCLDILDQLEAESVDSICCDPPYHLTSIVNRFGSKSSAPAKSDGQTGVYARASSGFMGQQWDGGDIAFRAELWRKVLRVLKPGGFLISFSATRTYHNMTFAIEQAGFEVRDMIPWLYGSGFPKSHDVGSLIAKKISAAHAEIEELQARLWQGFGTSLKPAIEPAVLARKSTKLGFADNVLKHGTGALNIDGCRINGRWPANLIHDGSDTIVQLFPNVKSGGNVLTTASCIDGDVLNGLARNQPFQSYEDDGSAARFFYSAKADAADRLGSKHPTIKPLDLMRYLVRLITPPGGRVLDMFAGTGTTGEAALVEGMSAILIEQSPQYRADISNRMNFAFYSREMRKAHHATQRPAKPSKAEEAGQINIFDMQQEAV